MKFAIVVIVCLITAFTAVLFRDFLPGTGELKPQQVVCLNPNANYDNLILIADLPDTLNLKTQSDEYLDLYYAYRFHSRNSFVLSAPKWRCGNVIDAASLRLTLGSDRFDTAFVIPPNPHSMLADVRWFVFFALFASVGLVLGMYNDWVSQNYSGRWRGDQYYEVDEPQKLHEDLHKKFRDWKK
jgi:hypothetical protein